jgi:hypothetical protein
MPGQSLHEISKGNMGLLRSRFDVINEKTVQKFGDVWNNNFDKIKEQITEENDLSKFTNSKSGKTCMICSNGPSLGKTYKQIKEHLNGTIDVFTVNGAINFFGENNIKQDFSVIIHPTADQTKHFDRLDRITHSLLFGTQCSPKVAKLWKEKGGKIYFFHSYMPSFQESTRFIEEKKLAIVGANMSVAYSATEIAMGMGYKKIIYVGFDFSYVDSCKYLNTPVKFDEVIPRGAVLKKDVFTGQPVLTDEVLLTSKDVLSALFENTNFEFINASGAGILDHPKMKKINIVEAFNMED